MQLRRLCLILVFGVALIFAPQASSANPAGHAVFRPGAHPYGQSMSQLSARYMRWLMEIPLEKNPAANPNSPRNCAPRGKVVFMGVSGTGDGCTVPRGSAVAFTFLGFECSTAEGNGATFHALRRCAVKHFGRAYADDRVHVSIDGSRLHHPRRWTFVTAPRVARLPKHNLWNAPAGRTKTISKGVFYVLRPLARGHHVIRGTQTTPHRKFVFRYPFTVS